MRSKRRPSVTTIVKDIRAVVAHVLANSPRYIPETQALARRAHETGDVDLLDKLLQCMEAVARERISRYALRPDEHAAYVAMERLIFAMDVVTER